MSAAGRRPGPSARAASGSDAVVDLIGRAPAGDRDASGHALKEVPADKAHLVRADENALFPNPLVWRLWAPRGKTPALLGDGGHRREASVIGAVSVSPGTQRLGFYLATAPGGYSSAGKVVGFLRSLPRHLRGEAVVPWNGGGNHRRPLARKFLNRNKRPRPERPPPTRRTSTRSSRCGAGWSVGCRPTPPSRTWPAWTTGSAECMDEL